MKLKLLDLYSCEGGGSMGWSQAGFEVYGIDLFEDHSQKRYPFPSAKMDALTALETLLNGGGITFNDGTVLTLADIAVIAASPPCQHATIATSAINRSRYPRLIEPTRDLLVRTGLPYVIENVAGAALRDPITLCGTMFALSAVDEDGETVYLQRHRLFESNLPLVAPQHAHPKDVQWAGSYGGARRDKVEARQVRHGGYVPSKRVQQDLLGIDWMTERGMHQSLPPAYTTFLGCSIRHLVAQRLAS